MDGFKLLVDTNVVIGLEDAQPVQASLAELVRLSSEHAVGLFVDGATYDDVARDKDEARRVVTFTRATGARVKLCQAQAVGRFPAESYSLPIPSFPLQPLRPHNARTRARARDRRWNPHTHRVVRIERRGNPSMPRLERTDWVASARACARYGV